MAESVETGAVNITFDTSSEDDDPEDEGDQLPVDDCCLCRRVDHKGISAGESKLQSWTV